MVMRPIPGRSSRGLESLTQMAECPEEMALYAPLAQAEGECDVAGGLLLDVAQGEHLLLTPRQRPEGGPDAAAGVLADRHLAGARVVGDQRQIVDAGGAKAQAHPSAGPASVPARIHRDPGEPRAPVEGRAAEAPGLVRIQEHLLYHVLGLLGVCQQHATQPPQAPVVGGHDQVRPRGRLHVPLTARPGPLIGPDERKMPSVDDPAEGHLPLRVSYGLLKPRHV